MNVQCPRECGVTQYPTIYRINGYDLPVFKCPKCGYLSQSEISNYVTDKTTHIFGTYELAAKYALSR